MFLDQTLWGWGPKFRVIALWSIWNVHTKSWPHTKARTLQKVFGRRVVGSGGGGSTVSLAFYFGPKLWFWTWTRLNNIWRSLSNSPFSGQGHFPSQFISAPWYLASQSFKYVFPSLPHTSTVTFGHLSSSAVRMHIHAKLRCDKINQSIIWAFKV